jgi:hypothetical protein
MKMSIDNEKKENNIGSMKENEEINILIILILMAWRQYWRKTENIRMKKLT